MLKTTTIVVQLKKKFEELIHQNRQNIQYVHVLGPLVLSQRLHMKSFQQTEQNGRDYEPTERITLAKRRLAGSGERATGAAGLDRSAERV